MQPFLGFREVAQESFVENLEKVFLLDRPPLLLIVFEMPQHIHQRIGSGVAQLIPQRARHRHYSHGGPILSSPRDHDQSAQLPSTRQKTWSAYWMSIRSGSMPCISRPPFRTPIRWIGSPPLL